MEKIRVYTITPEQLGGFEKSKDGGLMIPDTFELYIVPSQEGLRKERITQLEAELANMLEPTQEELMEAGKMMHPYYMMAQELEMLKSE